jgi:uncharacterized protein involved in response to NO
MTTSPPTPAGAHDLSPRFLAAAPHRLMFFAGASNVMLAMSWWAAWMVTSRWTTVLALPYPPVFPGWLHGFVMQYQMLPSFIFGFLLTTFPKWTKQPELTRGRFVPVGLALVPRRSGTTWHARSCAAALVLGYLGLLAFAWHVLGGPPAWAVVGLKLGTHGLLLPVYFTVAHRMFPFFAAGVVAGYQPWRPMWLLAAVWSASLIHLALELARVSSWSWIADGALLLLTGAALWRWWPRGAKPGLLTVLFLGLAWLPIAAALYTADSVAHAVTGAPVLARAPAHALFIGFFGSTLIAMVTRVTQGHSGRPLVMPAVAWFAFVAIQIVAVARIVAELVPDRYAWFAAASIGWLVALAPWVARLGRIYLTPRVDQKPG